MPDVQTKLTELLDIKYPIIVAPMFLVSSPEMIIEAIRNGITAAIPALNFRSGEELRAGIRKVKQAVDGPMGVNLIVNKSNFRLKGDLQICLDEGVDYFITSLGNPKMVIDAAHKQGAKVFCDVVDAKYAMKVQSLGADAIIAVNNQAGGHAGPKSMGELFEELRPVVNIPVISAGGVARKEDVDAALTMGAAGISVGSIFIASDEAPVSEDYKKGIVDYGSKDIVMTTRLSGTPCTVINTPYVKDIGLEPTWLERLMKRHKRLKKIIKAILFLKGMKELRKSAYGFSYQKVWCAGPSIEHVHKIRPMKEIIRELVEE